MRHLPSLTLALIFALAPTALMAADTSPPAAAPAPSKADPLASVREHIAAKRWAAAIQALKARNDTGDADWNNLMGYSLRKASPPDLAGAEKFYNEALRLSPRHLGALEYSGELYLMLGNLPKAEERAATLAKACPKGCEEREDLEKAVARFKAAGNKYMP
jgi:tetratricopeptide (TPR) repeat protein